MNFVTNVLLVILCVAWVVLWLKGGIDAEVFLKHTIIFCCGGLFVVFGVTTEASNVGICIPSIIVISVGVWMIYKVSKSVQKKKRKKLGIESKVDGKYYITGDKHRDFRDVLKFCRDMETSKNDVLIVLGDAGLNYFDDKRDDRLKKKIGKLNITLFCLHGNKENRPQNVGTYGIRSFCGGKVYCEPQYPNILFAIDGEVYTFEGKKYLVVGGAHSVDKLRCLEENKPFWYDEMPDKGIKNRVEQRLAEENNSVYGMLTHTCPIEYLPTEMFISTKRNAIAKRKSKSVKSKKAYPLDIDRSTEEWLSNLEKRIQYDVWFCGHYHIDKQIDKIYMLYQKIRPLHSDK